MLNFSEKINIIEYNNVSEQEYDEDEIILRDYILDLISKGEGCLTSRLLGCLKLCRAEIFEFDSKFWAGFYLSLERMGEEWTDMLLRLKNKNAGDIEISGLRAERLVSYFIYRHFANLCLDYGAAPALIFCILCAALILAIGRGYKRRKS